MNSKKVLLATAMCVIATGSAFGQGGPFGAGGLPPGVTVGPPPTATVHIPSGVAAGQASDVPGFQSSSEASAASLLGSLNAAHANKNALAPANPNSMVGDIATYEQQMQSALALSNPTQQTNAITAARQQLASSTNKRLTSAAVMQLDQILGINGANPFLGANQ